MIDEQKARQILGDLQAPEEVIDHVEMVNKVCLGMMELIRQKNPALKIDKRLVSVGALLHDIGRTQTQGIDHAVVGARILRELNKDNDSWMEKVALICERHIGGGITKAEAVRLGLPARDYVPKTTEEKIVSYCDNLVDEDETGTPLVRDSDWVLAKYERKHGKNSEPARMVRELNKFFKKLLS